MKHVATIAAAFLAAVSPSAFAQGEGAAAAKASEAAQPTALEFALTGFHVNILQNSKGGTVSVAGPAGEPALVAFLEPAAARKALGEIEDKDVSVSPASLGVIMQSWKGPIIFEGAENEVESAKEIAGEGAEFLAPVFFVTSDDLETRIKTPEGMVVPILTSHADAEAMASKLEDTGVDAATIKVVPIEFAAVLKQISSPEAPAGYRIYTHPGTIGAMQAATAKEQN